jgi:hypothetical protein
MSDAPKTDVQKREQSLEAVAAALEHVSGAAARQIEGLLKAQRVFVRYLMGPPGAESGDLRDDLVKMSILYGTPDLKSRLAIFFNDNGEEKTEAEAERVFARIERELPEAEARAERLRRLYGI